MRVADDSRISIKGKVLANELADDNGWYATSDAGHFEGEKLIVDGRIDDIVITGGENVSLTAIERVILQTFPDIQVAAFAVPHPEWGQAIHCALVGASREIEGQIQGALQRELGAAAKAKSFHYLSELPLLGIGKVDRKELERIAHE